MRQTRGYHPDKISSPVSEKQIVYLRYIYKHYQENGKSTSDVAKGQDFSKKQESSKIQATTQTGTNKELDEKFIRKNKLFKYDQASKKGWKGMLSLFITSLPIQNLDWIITLKTTCFLHSPSQSLQYIASYYPQLKNTKSTLKPPN